MLRQILATKYGVDSKDVIFIDPGPLNRLPSLMSGAADAAIVSAEERYQAVEQGMKDFMYLGQELKNSWGTIATSDRFIKEQPKHPAYAAVDSDPAVRVWAPAKSTIAVDSACAPTKGGKFVMVAALSGRFRDTGGIDKLLSR